MTTTESRHMFRMVHVPCEGRCYAPGEVLGLRGLGLTVAKTADLLSRIIAVHEPACGREQISFALDFDEHSNTFIAVFVRFGHVSTYVRDSAASAIEAMTDGALTWYSSAQGIALLAANPGSDKDSCEHGQDDHLASFALRHSGLSPDDQATVARLVA